MAIEQRVIRVWSSSTGHTPGASHTALGHLLSGFVRFMAPVYHGLNLTVHAILADGNKVELTDSPTEQHGTTLINHGLDASGELIVEVQSAHNAVGVQAFEATGYYDNGISGVYNPVDITRYAGMYSSGATVNGNKQMVGFMSSTAEPEKYGDILLKDKTAFRLAPSTSGRMVLVQMSLDVEGGQAQREVRLSVRNVTLTQSGNQYKPGATVFSSSPSLFVPMGATGRVRLQYTNVLYARGETDVFVTKGFLPTIENYSIDAIKVFNGTVVVTVLSEPKAL